MRSKRAAWRPALHTLSLAVALVLASPVAGDTSPSSGPLSSGGGTLTVRKAHVVGSAEADQTEDRAGISVTAETAADASWPMAGANPQRTSWTPEEVRGTLRPIWYRVIEPYIAPYTQIIAANRLLYISTAGGLYALDAATGATAWVYPTELPLGNAPTVYNGVLYVGGYDHKLHALDALTGRLRWTYEAEAGFATNPLVLTLDGRTLVYAGNRDGRLYAVEDLGSAPLLAWSYLTEGPILFSAAYTDGTVYIASNDSYSYAFSARTGGLIWRSSKLPGAGFHAWWPVIYQNEATGADVVILAGSENYRDFLDPSFGYDLQGRETADIWPDRTTEPRGTLFGVRNLDGTADATRVVQYFEAKPWRRTYIVLDRLTGREVTFDFDEDGRPEYAPVLWHGTHSGNRYPPVVGADGILYQSNTYMSDEWIPGGHVSGWAFGSASISTPSARWIAMDEPLAYSAGGNLIYWSQCNDRSAGSFDIGVPNTRFFPSPADYYREWMYYSYNLASKVPGYNALYQAVSSSDYTLNNLFQGPNASSNGVYGQHGYQNPPIPYAGRVYLHRSNAVIAFGDYHGTPVQSPMAKTMTSPEADLSVTGGELRQRLAVEVGKILAAGHLRPGYRGVGLLDGGTQARIGDHLIDYWHDPSETLYTLVLALPHLPFDLQQSAMAYLREEYVAYPPHLYTHVGWRDGSPREPFDLPQEAEVDRVNHPAWVSGQSFAGWTWPPQMFYALWKYAEVFGSPKAIFDASRSRLETPPSDAYLIEYPYTHNAYVAGYLGYLELETLAGYPESASVKTQLTRLLILRAATFDKDTPYVDSSRERALSIARNFMYLVPELGRYLHDTIGGDVQQAIGEYDEVAPYWFVSSFDATVGEGANHHLLDYWALFQAKALILREPGIELVKYLDVPAVQVGDLYYIQNLVAVLEAGLESGLSKTGSVTAADVGEIVTYTLSFSGYTGSLTITDTLPGGVSVPEFLAPEGTAVWPTYDVGTGKITWSDDSLAEEKITLSYRVTVTTGDPLVLTSTAELCGPDGVTSTATFTVIANPRRCFLPLITRRW